MNTSIIDWRSQAGQDEWVYDIIGDVGFFVDVGAHDGVIHSNTYALEQIGWRGFCVEPNPDAYAQLITNRSCSKIQCAVSSWDAIQPVAPGEPGVVPFDGVRVGAGPPVTAYPLDYLLTTFVYRTDVDYLSIDVEGHELEVLAGMDFARCHIRLITIEHNLYSDGPARKDAIFAVLTGHGFERVREDVVAPGYGPYEDWYRNAG